MFQRRASVSGVTAGVSGISGEVDTLWLILVPLELENCTVDWCSGITLGSLKTSQAIVNNLERYGKVLSFKSVSLKLTIAAAEPPAVTASATPLLIAWDTEVAA